MPEHALASSTYYLKQTEGLTNACGTIAMIHALLNNRFAPSPGILHTACRGVLGLEGGEGVLEKFYQSTVECGAEERGTALDSSSGIGGVHNSLVAEGQSRQVRTGLHCTLDKFG